MKKLILCSFIACVMFACSSAKKANPTAAVSDTTKVTDTTQLAGSWELNYVAGSTAVDSLYPTKKPVINFDMAAKRVSGNTGCNSFNGPLMVTGHKIDFTGPMALTKMFCTGQGETVFLDNLKKVNTWSVSDGNTLNFIMGDIAIMRFTKK
ncbi:META domain-containing protein [Mucilaginibacter agri]|uniref:META domain-containing protein n=1 Tax=Mucilaginibacter agri TaxID=2695265 RepID=A0A965ZI91_9SPHI|nr:META domain-containing protein [Mucilaginibacter agri]NCD70217.1 META domain-containing protein [Mucilaginibacter agri]